CRSGARSVTPRAKSTWRGRPATPRQRSQPKSRRPPNSRTPFNAIEDRVGTIIKDVSRTISFGVGRTNEEQVDHELFDDAEAWAASDMESYRQKAAAQLGTVGSGNHYVDLLRDEDGFVWGARRPSDVSPASKWTGG